MAFFGLARIGEVIRDLRVQPLLPQDHCSDLQVVFLKREGSNQLLVEALRGNISRSTEGMAVALLTQALAELEPSEKLYYFGPSAYRACWDFLLGHFGLQNYKDRGGGAVWVYHRGCTIGAYGGG